MTAFIGGLIKEGVDLAKKWDNPSKGTNWEIVQDSLKDIKNNFIGNMKGLSVPNINDCGELIPPSVRRKLY